MKQASLGARIGPLIAGQVFLHGSMAGMRMAAPLLALQQGYGNAGAGVLVALFSLIQVFVSLPAGRFADRHGFKRPMRWCVVMACSGLLAAVAWPIFPVLCVTALCCGGAVGCAAIAMQRHVGRVAQTPGELGRAFSLAGLAPAGANMLGPLVAGLLIDHAGFRAAFAALAVLPLLAWLLARGVRDDGGTPASSGTRPGTGWDLLTVPHMRRLMFMNVLITSAWDFHAFMVPVLGHDRGISASGIGTILGCFAAAVALVRFLVPAALRHAREWRLITVAAAAVGGILLVYPFARSVPAMAVLSTLLGIAAGAVQPMALTLLHYISPPHRRGEAMAMRIMFSNSTGVLMPMLLGAAGGLLGASGVFWLMGSLVVAGSRFGTGLRGVEPE
ncbi:MAG TPA: MFS transporter [Ramlibacter sp.]|nr:MFS transporter [Ramlibacter sp.]